MPFDSTLKNGTTHTKNKKKETISKSSSYRLSTTKTKEKTITPGASETRVANRTSEENKNTMGYCATEQKKSYKRDP